MVNVPLAEGNGSEEFRAAVTERWVPALDAHRPQLLFISAGFDAHREDPLAGLKLTEADYAWVTRELMDVARRHCDGRIVSSLEGGYALSALGRSVAEHVREFLGA
jgi:acetoin utilization deacetylase AcuC-like enzyme